MPVMKPLFGTPLNRAHPLSQGLAGCWLFNEGSGLTAYDSSGNGNNGTLMGSPLPTWISGARGTALSFGSTGSSVVSIPRTPITTYPFSIVLLFSPHSLAVVNKYIEIERVSYWALMYMRTNGSNMQSFAGSNTYSASFGVGNHIAISTFTATGPCNSYLDNTVTSSVNGSSSGGSNMSVFLGNSGAGDQIANGDISTVMAYDHVLSAPEISYLNAFPYCMFDPDGAFDPGTINTLTVTGFPI